MTIHRISPAEAQAKLLEGWTYVDVRTPDEFGDGHPAGAINVPIALSKGGTMSPNPDFVSVVTAHVGANGKIVLGCKSGGRSMRAAQALEKAGFGELFEQRAGWDGARDPFGQIVEPGWSRAALPTEIGQPEGRSWASLQGLARK
jgi:rhodanese-related sulfurtransferase